jgi:hypothetical protein
MHRVISEETVIGAPGLPDNGGVAVDNVDRHMLSYEA